MPIRRFRCAQSGLRSSPLHPKCVGEAPCLADAAVYRNRRCRSTLRCATALRLTPARVTQSTTLFYVEDWKRRVLYFFFRRAFVLRAPFFAADFVFVFRFFAMLPS
jgi:hypothetical protein